MRGLQDVEPRASTDSAAGYGLLARCFAHEMFCSVAAVKGCDFRFFVTRDLLKTSSEIRLPKAFLSGVEVSCGPLRLLDT